jgi:hypothetical protein
MEKMGRESLLRKEIGRVPSFLMRVEELGLELFNDYD